MKLPMQECKYGYPGSQLRKILSPEKLKDFHYWMRGQTFSSCDGIKFDYEQNRMVSDDCGPHGFVYYSSDVQRFLDGKPIID